MGQFLTLNPGLMLSPLLSQLYLACRATRPGRREENCLSGREGLLKRLSSERAATKSRKVSPKSANFTPKNQPVAAQKWPLLGKSSRQITHLTIQIPLRTLPEWSQTTTFLKEERLK
jgi:hypothetical protein